MLSSIAERIIRETAARFKVPMPDDLSEGLDGFGSRPRLGRIIDHYNPALGRPVTEDVFMVGAYRFIPADYSLRRGEDHHVRLTEKERDILLALLRAERRSIDRRTMLETVWGYASGVETHTLETHIYRLRQKIETDPAKPSILLTDGDSYRLA